MATPARNGFCVTPLKALGEIGEVEVGLELLQRQQKGGKKIHLMALYF